MKSKLRLTISARLAIGFAIPLILLLVISWVSVSNMKKFEVISHDIDDLYAPSLATIGSMHGDIQDSERLLLRLILETDAKERERLNGDLDVLLVDLTNQRKKYEELIVNDAARAEYAIFSKNFDIFAASIPALSNMVKAGQAQSITVPVLMQVHPNFVIAAESLDKLIIITDEAVSAVTAEAFQMAEKSKDWSITLTILAILFMVSLAIIISIQISRPIVKLASRVNLIAKGDFTVEPLVFTRNDEIGNLVQDFNRMVRELRSVLSQVSMNAHHVASTSEQLMASAEQTSQSSEAISTSIQDIAAGTDQQARSAVQASKASDEMTRGVEQISASIMTVASESNLASEKAIVGNQLIEDTFRQMNVIQDKTAAATSTVHLLGEKSNEIDSIVKIITTIALQTKILALNAGIEAARAGEQGKGFAVVATEVRKLAEQSTVSAEQISELLGEMKLYTEKAIEATQEGSAAVTEGIAVVHDAGASFRDITTRVTSISSQAQEVSAVVQQLSSEAQLMLHSIQQIAQLSEKSADSTQHIAAATEEQTASMQEVSASSNALAKMAEDLQEAIIRFKV
jgi:methyl-accepting chemotaxis protein